MTDDNVIDMEHRRGKKKGATRAQLMMLLVKHVTNKAGSQTFTKHKWPYPHFYAYAPDIGHKILVQSVEQMTRDGFPAEGGLVVPTTIESLGDLILKDIQTIKEKDFEYTAFGKREAYEAAETFLSFSKPVEVRELAEADSYDFCFSKLPGLITRELDPTWECWLKVAESGSEQELEELTKKLEYHFLDFLYRTKTNRIPLAQFIWSIFEPRSYAQQYLYMYGRGGDGKGSLLNMLHNLLGASYTVADPKFSKDKHWTDNFVGKRVIAFADTKSPGFATSGLMKTLTGSDAVTIEGKGVQKFSTKINAKFIFASNDKLQIDVNSNADLRRAVYVEIDSFKGVAMPADQWEQVIKDEAMDFLSLCRYIYEQKMGGKHGAIIADHSRVFDTETFRDLYPIVADELFHFPNEHERKADEAKLPKDKEFKISRQDFVEAVVNSGHIKSWADIGKFKLWLIDNYGVKADVQIWEGKTKNKYHLGLKKIPANIDCAKPGFRGND